MSKLERFLPRTVITSAKWYTHFRDNSNNRLVLFDPLCEWDSIYFLSRKGSFLKVDMKDKSIWAHIYNEQGWPTGVLRKIR